MNDLTDLLKTALNDEQDLYMDNFSPARLTESRNINTFFETEKSAVETELGKPVGKLDPSLILNVQRNAEEMASKVRNSI